MSALPHRPDAAETRGRRLLVLAAALHAILLGLWASGALDRLFFASSLPGTRDDSLHAFYQAGVNLRVGLSPYTDPALLDRAVERAHSLSGFRYLPPVAWAFAGLSVLLPARALDAVWPLVLEGLLLLAVWLTLRTRRFGERRWAAAAMWLVFSPFFVELHLGQVSMLMAVGILLLLLEALGAPALAPGFWSRRALDVVWSGTMVVKAFTALLAVPYARARWRARAVAGVGLVAVAAGAHFARHPDDLRRYLAINGEPFLAQVYPGLMSLQALVRSLTDRVLPAAWRAAPFTLGPFEMSRANLPSAVACAAVFGIALWATLRMRRDDLFRGLGLWVTVFFLLYRQVWEYHFLMLLPVVACTYLATGARWPVAVWALMALPTPFALLARSAASESGPAWVLYHAMKPAAALITFGMLVARPVRVRVAAVLEGPAPVPWALPVPAGAALVSPIELEPAAVQPSGNGGAPELEPALGPPH
jgi:hypothetical protein